MTIEEKEVGQWKYVGYGKKTGPKFRRYTGETAEDVVAYLKKVGVSCRVENEGNLVFIYKEQEPSDRFSPRYSYYPTTGRWGDDTRSKHYHSNGIEDFMSKYYETLEETEEKRRKAKEERRERNSSYVKIAGKKEQVFSYEVAALRIIQDKGYIVKRGDLYITYPNGDTYGPAIKYERYDLFGLSEVKRKEASTPREIKFFKNEPPQLAKATFSNKRRVDAILRQLDEKE